MPSTWLRERLDARRDAVDPEEYAMSLFYVRHDEKHYRACRRDLAGERR